MTKTNLQPGDRVIYYSPNKGEIEATYLEPMSRSLSQIHIDGDPNDLVTAAYNDRLRLLVPKPEPAPHIPNVWRPIDNIPPRRGDLWAPIVRDIPILDDDQGHNFGDINPDYHDLTWGLINPDFGEEGWITLDEYQDQVDQGLI